VPLLAALAVAGCDPALRTPAAGWHLSWRAETVFAGTTTTTTSCRFLARLSGFGSRLRAEFTSAPGSRGYSITSASIASAASPTRLDIVPGSSRPLAFSGHPSTVVGGGRSVLSDPLPATVHPGRTIAVTVTATAGDAVTKGGRQEPGACAGGQPAAVATAPAGAFPVPAGVRWLRSLLVDGPLQRSIAALGDSITEGATGSAPFGYDRWTDRLAAGGVLVGNAGVSGGAVGRVGVFGTMPGTARATALLGEPNVTDLMVLLGTNDLSLGSSGAEVLTGLDNVLSQARARGVSVWMGTILPRSNVGWTSGQEAQRRLVNTTLRGSWLTSRGGRLIDTDVVMRDPASSTRLRPAYDCGDHLHPNAAGESVLGAAVLRALGPIPLPAPVPAVTPTPTPTTPTPMLRAPDSPHDAFDPAYAELAPQGTDTPGRTR
jgi:lysophospholipase L1-like esterase